MENEGCACACGACSLRCVLRHSNSSFNSNGLSFFKVLQRDFTSFLEIPWKIAGGKDGLSKVALLMGSNGCLWPTKLCIDNGIANFRNGWETFVSDHCLNVGDIVVFKHIIHTDFLVQIFGPNGYEKQCVKEGSHSRVCNHGGKSYDCLEIIAIEEENNEDTRIIVVREEEDIELACNPAAMENFTETDLAIEMVPRYSQLASSCTPKKRKPNIVQEIENDLTSTKHKLSRRNFVEHVTKLVITDNPKFGKSMAESSVTGGCRLSIPRLFGGQWLQNQHDVVLKSHKHSDLLVVKIHSYLRFYGFTSGWRCFVIAHNLEEGDACVFELVDRKRGIFKVHVFKLEDFQRQRFLEM
ncbi:hypothetical protein KI387_030090 [Taxus chinensis]|uniref:TF-B3 domain-containing protein n=1 Tax=Taxus chinensis TaxID=29808 RepID=A0AA38CGP2_TAXCH|nr:hypothetical protein KI387_030090 [Taxus chinensis]